MKLKAIGALIAVSVSLGVPATTSASFLSPFAAQFNDEQSAVPRRPTADNLQKFLDLIRA